MGKVQETWKKAVIFMLTFVLLVSGITILPAGEAAQAKSASRIEFQASKVTLYAGESTSVGITKVYQNGRCMVDTSLSASEVNG